MRVTHIDHQSRIVFVDRKVVTGEPAESLDVSGLLGRRVEPGELLRHVEFSYVITFKGRQRYACTNSIDPELAIIFVDGLPQEHISEAWFCREGDLIMASRGCQPLACVDRPRFLYRS